MSLLGIVLHSLGSQPCPPGLSVSAERNHELRRSLGLSCGPQGKDDAGKVKLFLLLTLSKVSKLFPLPFPLQWYVGMSLLPQKHSSLGNGLTPCSPGTSGL